MLSAGVHGERPVAPSNINSGAPPTERVFVD